MATLDDLRDAFTSMEQRAPARLSVAAQARAYENEIPVDLGPAGRLTHQWGDRFGSSGSHGRRVRWAIPITLAACVGVAVAVLSLTLANTETRPTSPAATVLPPSGHILVSNQLRLAFSVDPGAGYSIDQVAITAAGQSAELIAGPTGKPEVVAGIEVWASGQIKPDNQSALFPAGTQLAAVTMNGQQAWTDDLKIAWRWAPDRWATVRLPSPDSKPKLPYSGTPMPSAADRRAELVRIAESVRFPSGGQTLRLPFRIGYLSSDVTISETSWETARPKIAASTQVYTSARVVLTDAADPQRQLSISVTTAPSWKKDFCPDQKGIGVARFTWQKAQGCWETSPTSGTSGNMSLRFANGTVLSVAPIWHGVAKYDRAELEQIAETITVVSDVNNTSSWYETTSS